MSWSKIENKESKPIGWWYYKILCEFGWWVRNNISYSKGDKIYYKYLKSMWYKYKINVYGNGL
jgi:hypothetical protein